MKSESIKELTAALAKAQIAFNPIKRTEKVGFDTTKGRKQYNYAPLIEVIEATKQALSDNSLAVTQSPMIVDGNTLVETLLSHSSGEWISSVLYVGKQDQPPQSEGSALTYKRRYGLSAILNVSSEDDDDGITVESAPHKEPVKKDRPIDEPKKQDKPPESKPGASAGISEAQTKKIYAAAREKQLSPEEAKSYIKKTFNKTSTKELTKDEASVMIEFLNEIKPGESKLVRAAKEQGSKEA